MTSPFEQLSMEMGLELRNLLKYWSSNALDDENDGFIGKRDFYNNPILKSNKGIILNSRILWTFAAASNHLKTLEYTSICERAFDYLYNYFKDEKYGGVYWELTYNGSAINKRKQIYAQAFTIYALSEYYTFSKNTEALEWAIEIFNLIEKHAHDYNFEGYIEAFNEDWSPIQDMRLSDKDENEAKTMNTHLHILEAYTSLYKAHKDSLVKSRLANLVQLFLDKFLTKEGHLKLFFDAKWQNKSRMVSYGHDIETAWLLYEAAKATEIPELIKKTEQVAVLIADTFIAEGIDASGGVLYEYDPITNHLDTDKHWWPQAEAIVGLNYAYRFNPKKEYASNALNIWNFTKRHLLDAENGEWYWRVDENGIPNSSDCKMGMWKAPYHNSRACMILDKQN